MTSNKITAWVIGFAASFLLAVAPRAAEPLDRDFAGILVGMTVQEFLSSVGGLEHEEMFQGLIPGERLFEVAAEKLPAHVKQIGCRFYEDRLYKIAIEFNASFSEEKGWDQLMEDGTRRFGKIKIEQRPIRNGRQETARWEDPATAYILTRSLAFRFKDKKLVETGQVVAVYLDRALWDRRLAAEMEGYSLF